MKLPKRFSEHAKALSDLGSSKGGKARMNVLTPDERSEIARKAVQARWAKAGKTQVQVPSKPATDAEPEKDSEPQQGQIGKIPTSLLRGTLNFGSITMECHVLDDHRRVFTQREMVRVLTAGVEEGNLPRYLKGNPLITNEIALEPVIRFRVPGTQFIAHGREATTLIEICSKYQEARDEKQIRGAQLTYAKQADIIIRSCAKVGIIALIDEATGFQKMRAERALQLKLQAFIAEELQEWARTFEPEFWFELARLEGIAYSPRSRPLRWGKYIMAFVYDAIDADVGRELRAKNPSPHFKQNHHQWLKQFGKQRVHDQILKVITIMKLCSDMTEFKRKFAHVFKRTPLQLSFDDVQNEWATE